MTPDLKSVRTRRAEGGWQRAAGGRGGVPPKPARPVNLRGVVRTVSNFEPFAFFLKSASGENFENRLGVGGVAA